MPTVADAPLLPAADPSLVPSRADGCYPLPDSRGRREYAGAAAVEFAAKGTDAARPCAATLLTKDPEDAEDA